MLSFGHRDNVIRQLRVNYFKGTVPSTLFFGKGANLCVGDVGAGKTRLFDALWLLSMIARGAEASIARYGWWSASVPSEIAIQVDSATIGSSIYSIQVRQDGLFSVVLKERFEHNGEILLRRVGGRFHQTGVGDFDIEKSRFALSAVVVRPVADPIENFRTFLRSIWLLSPCPAVMTSGLQTTLPSSDMECRYLAHYIVNQQRMHPQIYGLLMAYQRALGVGLDELSIRNDNFGRQYLAVHMNSEGGKIILPFECLSTSEKSLMLASFVCVINEHVEPICCVWDDPLNGLGDRAGVSALRSLSRSFGGRGQLILFSQYRSVIEDGGNFNKTEVHS